MSIGVTAVLSTSSVVVVVLARPPPPVGAACSAVMVMMVIATPIIVMVSVAVLPAVVGGASKLNLVPVVRVILLGSAWTGRIEATVIASVRGKTADVVTGSAICAAKLSHAAVHGEVLDLISAETVSL